MHHQTLFSSFAATDDDASYIGRLINEGCDEDLVKDLVALQIISEYESLYYQYKKLLPAIREDITELWPLLILSGEERAYQFALENGISKETHGKLGENVLHYAALSGSSDRLKDALALGIPFNSETFDKLNILHFAALSHEPDQLKTVLQLERSHQLLPRVAKKKRNVLHCAALTGNAEMVKIAIDLVNPHAEDNYGYTALNYAIKSNNQQAIYLLKQSAVEPGSGLQNDFSFGEASEKKRSPLFTQR